MPGCRPANTTLFFSIYLCVVYVDSVLLPVSLVHDLFESDATTYAFVALYSCGSHPCEFRT